MKTSKHVSGLEIPQLGYGTWQLLGEDCVNGVRSAIEIGYTHIDTADAYGNHTEVARGIRESGKAREELFITTKVWNTKHTYDDVLASGERFLSELDIPYIDLLLIHWPVKDVPIEETLRAMQELKDKNIIRAIGVSNFTEHHLEDALKTGIEIVTNQVEVHPHFNQQKLREYHTEHSILTTAYSPLGRGKDLEDPVILELAEKYSASPAQIALAWVLARNMIAIPKSSKPERIKENFDAASLTLDESDLARIDVLPQGERMGNPPFNEFNY